MASSQNPRKNSDSAAADEVEFEQTLATVARSLQDLQTRYAQVQQDQQRQLELKNRIDQVRASTKRHPSPELKAELQTLQQQLEELELALESRLFSWDGLKEVFWQAVRFGGLGIILGWGLAFYTLQPPQPQPPNPAPIQSK
jgi:seryl-tRNA synthetase